MTDIQNDEISLREVFAFYLRNWIALTVLPVIVAVAAYFIASSAPQTYTATALLAPPTTGAEITSSLYLAAASVRPPVVAAVADGSISVSARSHDKVDAEQVVRSSIESMLSTVDEAIADESARLDRQRALLDQIWQSIGGDPQSVLNASSMEGAQTSRADRLALVERWAAGARGENVKVSADRSPPFLIAILAFFAALLCVSAILLTRTYFRPRQHRTTD